MHARVITYSIKREHMNDRTIEKMEMELPDRIRAIPGIRHTFHLGRRSDCKAMVVAIYESEEAIKASAERVRAVWADWMFMIDGEISPLTYEVMLEVHV